MKCLNSYCLPVNKKQILKRTERKYHTGALRHAWDIYIPEGSPIYAAAGGKVVWVKKDSKFGGHNKKKYWFKGNRIVVRHNNDEYTAYEHMKYKGVLVKTGQNVRKGQRIGLAGSTGYSREPHLHFEVFSKPLRDQSEGTTLQVSFKELKA